MLMTLFWRLYCWFWTDFTHVSGVSTVDFEQVNAGWVSLAPVVTSLNKIKILRSKDFDQHWISVLLHIDVLKKTALKWHSNMIFWKVEYKSYCNRIRTNNHLVCKRTLNRLAKLASLGKWLGGRLRTKWLWVRILLQSLKCQISRLFWARSSLTFR